MKRVSLNRPNHQIISAVCQNCGIGRGSIVFWGGIWESLTEVVSLQGGALSALRYVEIILQDLVMSYMPSIGPESLLIRRHKTTCVSENVLMQQVTVT